VDPEREVLLAHEHTTTRDVILTTLASLEIESYLREGGLSQTDLDAVRARLLEPSGSEAEVRSLLRFVMKKIQKKDRQSAPKKGIFEYKYHFRRNWCGMWVKRQARCKSVC
jgi:hypothetical protein